MNRQKMILVAGAGIGAVLVAYAFFRATRGPAEQRAATPANHFAQSVEDGLRRYTDLAADFFQSPIIDPETFQPDAALVDEITVLKEKVEELTPAPSSTSDAKPDHYYP